jgi:hypothetical protein
MKIMCRKSCLFNWLFCTTFSAVSVFGVFGQSVADTNASTGTRQVAINRLHTSPAPRPEAEISFAYSATQTYRIGVGDVLHVNIINSSNGRGFYPVRLDGTIDYALAGDNIVVAGLTVEAVGQMLASSIRLYRDPKVEVKIREYASHRVVVSGLVSNGGVRYIQREAVPLFVIYADADVNPRATKLAIRDGRTNAVKTYDLHDPNTANIVVNTGDELDFLGT